MNYISEEYSEFSLHHNNKINIFIHIISGVIYMSCFDILTNTNYMYMLLLFVTMHNTIIILLSQLSIQLCKKIIKKYEIKRIRLIILFFLFCFIIPEISHYLTNEPPVLNKKNITCMKLITNIVYFLPFSIGKVLSI